MAVPSSINFLTYDVETLSQSGALFFVSAAFLAIKFHIPCFLTDVPYASLHLDRGRISTNGLLSLAEEDLELHSILSKLVFDFLTISTVLKSA